MKNSIKVEEALLFLFSIFLFRELDFSWWYYLVFFLAPDLSMLGYLVNTKIGAISYNFFHHKGVAIAVYIGGVLLEVQVIQFIGLILLGHASLDRIFGYGLKYYDSFNRTHLGMVGKKKE